jgi:hypothetical protein
VNIYNKKWSARPGLQKTRSRMDEVPDLTQKCVPATMLEEFHQTQYIYWKLFFPFCQYGMIQKEYL